MKLSQAIEIIDELRKSIPSAWNPDHIDAINLAIGCLKFRMKMKEQWAFSCYEKLIGEEPEDLGTPVKA